MKTNRINFLVEHKKYIKYTRKTYDIEASDISDSWLYLKNAKIITNFFGVSLDLHYLCSLYGTA